MTLRDMDEKARMRVISDLDFREQFDEQWRLFTPEEQRDIVESIDHKLDELATAPDSRWGAIMNTSIEGGKVNPFNGKPGEWFDTPWAPIYDHCGQSEQQAALFFGSLWKWRIIEHSQEWVGIRNDPVSRPTFPQRGVTLQGKTYFLPGRNR